MTQNPEGLSQMFDADTSELESLYDTWADGYDADMVAWGYHVPVRVAERLASSVDTSAVVLDAGCGTGLSGMALEAVGFARIIGIDLSRESLARARQRGVYENLEAVDMTGSLPFDDNGFGAVACAGVMAYLTDTEAVLREFLRVTKPGGVVVFSQRTDLWSERGCDAALTALVGDGLVAAEVSEREPYLPGNDEYGTEIEVIYAELRLV